MKENILLDKATNFAVNITMVAKDLNQGTINAIFVNQIVRSSSSVMSNISEAVFASSKRDMLNKLKISLKEANETKHWLILMKRSLFLPEKEYKELLPQCEEIIKMLVSSCKTLSI